MLVRSLKGEGKEIVTHFLRYRANVYLLAALCTLACVLLFALIRPTPVTRAVQGRSLASVLAENG